MSSIQFGSIGWHRKWDPNLPGPYYLAENSTRHNSAKRTEILHIVPLKPAPTDVPIQTGHAQYHDSYAARGTVDPDKMAFVFQEDKQGYYDVQWNDSDVAELHDIIGNAEFLMEGQKGKDESGTQKLEQAKKAARRGTGAAMIVYVSGQLGQAEYDRFLQGPRWNPPWDSMAALMDADQFARKEGHRAGYYLVKGPDVERLITRLKRSMNTETHPGEDASRAITKSYQGVLQPGTYYKQRFSILRTLQGLLGGRQN